MNKIVLRVLVIVLGVFCSEVAIAQIPETYAGVFGKASGCKNNFHPATAARFPDKILAEGNAIDNTDLYFTSNLGQVTDQFQKPRTDIQFKLSATPGLNIFIGNGALHYQFSKDDNAEHGINYLNVKPDSRIGLTNPTNYTMYRMDVELVGANKAATIITEQPRDYFEHYYTSGASRNGVTTHSYNKIVYKDIYPSIDWVLITKGGKLEHEFVVRKGGKVSDIKFKYGGATDIKLNENGDLIANTPMGAITEQAPYTYQSDGKIVSSGFKLDGNELSYETGDYSGDIIIDPSLAWATYYGGAAFNDSKGITTDAAGNVYMTGNSASTSGIATTGAYQVTYGGGGDAYIVKFNSAGVIQWATYYGGSGTEWGNGIATDGSGNVYITGYTQSATAIATTGAHQTSHGGRIDAFLAKFDGAGNLQWGTYVGGTGDEFGYGVATDGSGNVYITGKTQGSPSIPTTGAYQTTYGGGFDDAFLAKFNSSGVVQWATYYGGSGWDDGIGVATDASGNVYITGDTQSPSAIATTGAYQSTFGGYIDAYLVKFDSSGARVWASYYGGTTTDVGQSIATDGYGNVYMTGYTLSTSSIATSGAYQSSFGGGTTNGDGFLVKFNSSGAQQWGTYFGGSDDDFGAGVTLDGNGNVYIAGFTQSTSSIATAGAYQSTFGGVKDAFYAKFNSSGGIIRASYFGRSGDDAGSGIAISGSGGLYMSGVTISSTGIATTGAYQTTIAGSDYNAFVAKFYNTAPITGTFALCTGYTTTLSNTTTGGTWSSSNTAVATIGSGSGVVTGVSAGTATITYNVTGEVVTAVVTVSQPTLGGGIITTVGGNGGAGFSGDGGAATSGNLSMPVGVAVDGVGNIFFVDNDNRRIRKIDTNGIITTVAGNGSLGHTGDDGPATAASFSNPWDVCVDRSGNLYVADYGNNCIRKISTSGIITNFAGNGYSGYSWDGGPATICNLNSPTGVAVDALGNVYIADMANERVRKVDVDGIITTVAGTGANGFSGDGGPATLAVFYVPARVAVDGLGNIYISDRNNHRIRKVNTSGIISTVAGGGIGGDGVPATNAGLNFPFGIHIDNSGNLYISDVGNGKVRKIDNAGVINTVAGTGTFGYSGDGGPATSAQLRIVAASGLTTDRYGDLYIGDAQNNRIRKVSFDLAIIGNSVICEGSSTTLTNNLAGGTWSSSNTGVATVGSTGIVNGISTGTSTISYIVTSYCNTDVAVATVTVNPMPGAGVIGGSNYVCTGGSSVLTHSIPGGVWSSSSSNATILGGTVTGVTAGTAIISYATTNACGTFTAIKQITINVSPSIALGSMPTVCAGDTIANLSYSGTTGSPRYSVIWSDTAIAAGFVSTPNIISTIAGNYALRDSYTGDGGAATAAGLYGSSCITIDKSGNIYIGEGYYGNRVRKVTPAGIITTVAGTGTMGYSGDGGPATNSELSWISSLAADDIGNLYISDGGNYKIRKVNAAGIITTIAGVGTFGFSGDGGPATLAQFNSIIGLVADNLGNLYLSDYMNGCIRKIDANGIITTMAGVGAPGSNGYSGDGGPATSAYLDYPRGLALDKAGNLFIADQGNGVVRKVTPTGIISTVAGNNAVGFAYSGDGGPATASGLYQPNSVAVGKDGTLYIAQDFINPSIANYIRKVTPNGIISTIAGINSTSTGYAGDGGPATAAQMNFPYSVVLDETGDIYFSDQGNSVIRKVTNKKSLTSSPIPLAVPAGCAPRTYYGTMTAYSGNCASEYPINVTVSVPPSTAGVITGASSVCMGRTTTFSDATTGGTWSSSNTAIASVGSTGVVSGVSAGTATISYTVTNICGSAIATKSLIVNPSMPVTHVITTVAGNGSIGFSGDGGSATAATLGTPFDVCTDATGNIYIADGRNHVVRKVDLTGTITTFAGNGAGGFSGDGGQATNAQLNYPFGVAVDAIGQVYIADKDNHRIRKVDLSGVITTIAGTHLRGSGGDGGLAISAQFNFPSRVRIGATGEIYVADYSNHKIRMIDTSGVITTFAGSTEGFGGDGGAATSAQLNYPYDMALGNDGKLYIADCYNHRIRVVNRSGIINTIAGNGGAGYSGDGGTASSAELNYPTCVKLDASGVVYVADYGNSRIRIINAAGNISTFAGTGTNGFGGDGGLATNANLNRPISIMLDNTGRLLIADNDNYRIRRTQLGVPNIYGTNNLCIGNSVVMANELSGGSWSTSNSFVASIDSLGLLRGNSAGVATISYTLTNTCGSAFVTKTITVNPLPNAGTITGVGTVAVGSAITLTNTVTGGVWSSSNIAKATVGTATGVVTGVAAGTATISYTVTNGCGSAVASKSITVTGGSSISPITGITTVCLGSTSTLANTTTGGIWSSRSPLVATIGSLSGVVTGVSIGTTVITYRVSTAYVTTTVTIGTMSTAITGSGIVCAGATTVFNNATTGGTWSSSNTAKATVGSVSGIVTGVAAGSAIITYTLGTGCRATKVVTISVTPGAIGGAGSVCRTATITLTNATAGGKWLSGNAGIARVGSTTGVVTGVSAGFSVITYYTAAGCSAYKTVSVNSVSSIQGTNRLCLGNTISLTDSSSGGLWTSGSTLVARVGSLTGVVTGAGAGVTAISYTVGTCRATFTLTVSNLAAIGGSGSVCQGQTTTLTNIIAGGRWSSGDATLATVGSVSGIVNGISAGTVNISYSLLTGCVAIKSISVVAIGAITGPSTICRGETITLTNTAGGGLWSSTSSIYATIGSTTGIVNGLANGSTTISYTVGGCRVTKPLFVNALSPITGTTNIAVGQVVRLTTVGAGIWLSSNTGVATIGSATGQATGVSAGTSQISFTTSTGCTALVTMTVNAVPAISGDTAVCVGQSTSLSNSVAGGTWVSGNTTIATIGATSGIVYGVTAGTVYITYRFPAGGYTVYQFFVYRLPLLSGPSSVCAGQQITLDNPECCGHFTSSASGIASVDFSTGSVTGITVGTTTISYTLPTGCITSSVISVQPLSPITGSTNVCVGDTIMLSNALSGGYWSSNRALLASIGSATGIVNGLSAGVVIMAYTLPTTGCTATQSISVVMCRQPNTQAVWNNSSFTLHPNPNTGTFVIEGLFASATDEQALLEVVDMLGQVVYSGTAMATSGKLNEEIQMGNNLANGMYLLNIKTAAETKVLHFVVGR